MTEIEKEVISMIDIIKDSSATLNEKCNMMSKLADIITAFTKDQRND